MSWRGLPTPPVRRVMPPTASPPVLGLVLALNLAGLGAACSRAPDPALPVPPAPDRAAEGRAVPAEPAPPAAAPEPDDPTPPADVPGTRHDAATEPAPEADPAAAPAPATDRSRASVESDTVTVTRPAPPPRGTSLWEAAVRARRERETAKPPAAVITDDNLDQYQGAELTFAGARAGAPAARGEEAEGESAEASPAEVAEPATDPRGEEYWRERVLDLRLRLRTAVDEEEELERRVAGLRRSFYAEDDPYVRDGRIKPAWDRARDRLEETRLEIVELRTLLDRSLEEGRRAGALPGWLREGIELEPRFEAEDDRTGADGRARDRGDLRTVEPVEPPEQTEEPPGAPVRER